MSIFTKPTVDSIMAGFQRTIDQLARLQEEKAKENGVLREQVLMLEKQMDANSDEVYRALAIERKLSEIVNPTTEMPF